MDGEDWVLKILASDKNINFTSRANPYASMADRPGYVIALSSIRRNETSPLVRHKTFNYGDSILPNGRPGPKVLTNRFSAICRAN